ncbi:NnrS family protein [Marinospirillum sp.]|uniref:NnrS family protein n=1 Tax=Marinospirillum sp. TaxID=2183934 RepID=UPI0028701C87|nr:NnrS family protein [Marinospirillum sp.]MDR9466781.1 NnrS family protein [Marinospirillum sp.]
MKSSLFSLGFRPFFLLAALGGSVIMLAWLVTLMSGYAWPGVQDPVAWHRHEMLFGYTGAVIAGFLLTAVRRWTGLSTPDGWPLALLAAVWVAARLTPLLTDRTWLYVLLDLGFWVGLWISLWPALHRAALHNRVFLLLIAGLLVAAALSHSFTLGLGNFWLGHLGAHLGLDFLLIIMLVVAGRVLPFFIQLGLQRPAFPRVAWLEKPFPLLLAALLVVDLTLPLTPWAGLMNLLLAAWLLPRLYLWHDRGIWRVPLLWSLYLAYAWLPVGLALRGLGMLDLVNPYAGIHALGVGGIGLLTLSMMSRVSLGHTGRPLQPSKWIVLALVLMLGAALVRVFTVTLLGSTAYLLSASLWIAALLLFLLVYLPILTRPRPDGNPG